MVAFAEIVALVGIEVLWLVLTYHGIVHMINEVEAVPMQKLGNCRQPKRPVKSDLVDGIGDCDPVDLDIRRPSDQPFGFLMPPK